VVILSPAEKFEGEGDATGVAGAIRHLDWDGRGILSVISGESVRVMIDVHLELEWYICLSIIIQSPALHTCLNIYGANMPAPCRDTLDCVQLDGDVLLVVVILAPAFRETYLVDDAGELVAACHVLSTLLQMVRHVVLAHGVVAPAFQFILLVNAAGV